MELSLISPSRCDEFGTYSKVTKKASAIPPLNLCIIGALAEHAGWQVQLIDAELEQLRTRDVLQRVVAYKPDLIGKTGMTPFVHRIVEMAKELKQENSTPIIVGGQHVSIVGQEAMEGCLDYLVLGECERVFKDFLYQLGEGERAIKLPGVMFRRDGKICYGGQAPALTCLDDSLAPARHLLRNGLYFFSARFAEENVIHQCR